MIKGELNPKIDSSPFEHLGIIEQLYEVQNNLMCCNESTRFDRRRNM